MEDLNNKLQRLLEQRLEWTREEKLWLLEYLENPETGELRILLEENYRQLSASGRQLDPALSDEILHRLHDKMSPAPATKGRLIRIGKIGRIGRIRIAAASIAVLLVIGALWQWNARHLPAEGLASANGRPVKPPANDAHPGGNKALLTLADGSTIVLGDAKNGKLARQGTTNVLKSDGKIAYAAAAKGSGEVLYNTIATPRGGQYEVELPDGSKVWLNAASSIRFPTAFKGRERRVQITGEAYFEVTRHPEMPFFVKVDNAEVQVLGTHFNIMAYPEESSIRTTLLEGSVRFTTGNNASLLVPGQQSQLNKEGNLKVEKEVNVEEAIAWKNGLFHFENADIETVMRQLSRWYDVDISYKDRLKGNLFFADIPRTTNLSDALKALALTGKVHFEIQGKNILVEE